MGALPRTRYTAEQYLEMERKAAFKSEYVRGEIFAMAGASFNHTTVAANIVVELGIQIKGRPCSVHSADLRVQAFDAAVYTYPDVVVVCGKPQLTDSGVDTVVNPTVIVEVLSPSTENYDRGEKFVYYQTIDSLMEYVLVAQDKYRVDHFARQSNGNWLLTVVEDPAGSILLASIDCRLSLADIYRMVEFAPDDPSSRGPNLRLMSDGNNDAAQSDDQAQA
jgi:Uma2 family endonuclease